MTSEPFGLGFIGCGGYGSSLANAASRSRMLKCVAFYDICAEHADRLAEKHGVEQCSDMNCLLARDDVQGVVIASPNNAHRGNVEAAVAAGKHVFVDKPIANSIEDALAIIQVVEQAGLALSVGHNGRRMGGHRKMKQMIEDGAVGVPVTVESNFSHAGGMGLSDAQWRFHRDQCPALPLMQLGVHFADTVQYLLGDVAEVASFMSHRAIPADNYDATVSVLRFGSGLVGYLGSNYATPPVYYVNVYGTEGNLYCVWGSDLRYAKAGSKEQEAIALAEVNTQVEELEEFAECAQTGKRPETDGRAGLMALAVVRAALKSSETRAPVRIDDLIAEARRG